jgi:hypothetical protein
LSWGTDDLTNLFTGASQTVEFQTDVSTTRGRVVHLEGTLLNDSRLDGNIEVLRVVDPIASLVSFAGTLQTNEFGASDSFTIRLASSPASDTAVILSFTSSDPSEGTVTPERIRFAPNDWDEPRTVTVRGVDDSSRDGNVAYSVQIRIAESGDPNFSGLAPRDILVINRDNDGDADGDGLSDSDEVLIHRTDPNRPDTDRDGLPDGYEVEKGFGPRNPSDGALDADGDGFSNREEFEAGTDPFDSDDVPLQGGLSPALLFRAFCAANPDAASCR